MEKVAGDGEEETEYESDPEEAKMSLKMRRREASDDEDGEEEEETKREVISSRSGIIVDSEGDSDGQGAAAEYDDEVEEEEEEEEEEDEEYYDEQEEFEEEEKVVGEDEYVEKTGEAVRKEMGEGGESLDVAEQGEGDGDGVVKKENEPFAVPTSGAFYMHDDRFRDNNNAVGRHRYTVEF